MISEQVDCGVSNWWFPVPFTLIYDVYSQRFCIFYWWLGGVGPIPNFIAFLYIGTFCIYFSCILVPSCGLNAHTIVKASIKYFCPLKQFFMLSHIILFWVCFSLWYNYNIKCAEFEVTTILTCVNLIILFFKIWNIMTLKIA